MKNAARFLFSTILFLAALLVGFGAGILLAPRSGKETRRRLMGLANETGEHLKDLGQQARRTATKIVGH